MKPPRLLYAPDDLAAVLGGTGSDPHALDLLVAGQRGQRLLTLRALLDAVRGAPAGTLPEGTADRLLRDWRLLEDAERADRAAARRVVHYPLTGAWAERCLRDLTRPGRAPRAAAELPHLAALAASAAARAGLRFTAEVPVRDGVLTLPTLGRYRPPAPTAGATGQARVDGDGNRLWLHLDAWSGERSPGPAGEWATGHPYDPAHRRPDDRGVPGRDPHMKPRERPYRWPYDHPVGRRPDPPRAVEVRRGPDGVWRSAAPGWRPIQALWTEDHRPVLIDDADPYRDEEDRTDPYGLAPADGLDRVEHAGWRTAWRDAQPWLRLGDGTRAREVDALLECVVPLAGSPAAQYSGTLGTAFGALLSSTPRGGLRLAAALVHELQHTKLIALSRLTPLHTADDTPRHWAPWRPDPRPFEGVFQGAYAHLALAEFHLAVALTATAPAVRESAWAAHCRRRAQVEAVLPQLLGSSRLTPQGRTVVTAMTAHHTRLARHVPPDGHLARAAAYVETTRAIWRRQRA
ncbi:aKG-HExxH-type peptide beta-hydroxylase [Streptomyces sp.]|uniref:aKG-HExxH-type peptide beta-hydroxylase n=1 Tax=Streptomyces sp. TaxID=1931 RepID=UPI002F41F860